MRGSASPPTSWATCCSRSTGRVTPREPCAAAASAWRRRDRSWSSTAARSRSQVGKARARPLPSACRWTSRSRNSKERAELAGVPVLPLQRCLALPHRRGRRSRLRLRREGGRAMTTLTAARGDTFTDTAGRQPGSDTRPAPRPRQRNAAVPAPADRIAKRRAAALALDPVVRAQLARLSPWPLAAPPSLTLYDTIWPATPEAGACWTLAAGLFGPLTHGVWSYAVTLCFD